ncbi:MlaD family protein [Roseibacillus persicicus]|uniref:MlaD family protein n=1 Tax=Roseibacillus persicicus TaxID=454148 RepID=UPI00398B63A1
MAAGQQRTATLVGLFIFVGIAVLSWLVLQFGRFQNSYDEVYNLQVRFSDASGVIEGTPVRLAGVRIGSVTGPPILESVTPPRVKVPIGVDATRKLPANAVFQIQSATVLGDKLIVVSIPEAPSATFLTDQEVIDGGGASGLEAIQNDAVAVAGDARILMADARTSLLKFDSALDDIRAVAGRLGETVEQINTKVLSNENVSSLGRTLANIEDASLGARNASADLKPVLVDARKAINQVNELAQKVEGTFDEIDAQLAHVGPAMEDVPETMRSIKRVADKAEGAVVEAEKTFSKASETLDTLNGEAGLVGTLTKDEEVTDDTKSFIKNLRRHGILGYKDEETPEDDPRERYRGRRR